MVNTVQNVIELEGISFGYSPETIFDNLSMKIKAGEHIGIVGSNGVGKTTLFRLLTGLIKPALGSIKLFNKEMITESDFIGVRPRIGYLFQDSDDQLFSPTVIDDVCFGLLNMGFSEDSARETAIKSLAELGIESLSDKITYKLSGGEKRLVAFATIYAMNPDVYLLDEPSAGLDSETEEMLARFVANLSAAVMVVSHNQSFMQKTVSSCLKLSNKAISV